jgi:polyphenol oxidase
MTRTLTRRTSNHVSFYQADRLETSGRVWHAIFTRRGGYSRDPFCSLNLSTTVGDTWQLVAANRQTVHDLLQISSTDVVQCRLAHGADVVVVGGAERGRVVGPGDGLVTNEPGLALTMNFGDCVPLLLHDPLTYAIGLGHAGWRGTVRNVAGTLVRAMTDRYQCRPRNLIALVGPSIGPCCYEVGPDVVEAVEWAFTTSDSLLPRPHGERAHFDLWAANQRQLAKAGVRQIIVSNLCTACHTEEFFSHRAEHGRTGRFGVFVGISG